MMTSDVTVNDIGLALGITPAAARRRAAEQGWLHISKPGRGGYQKRYMLDLLPDDIRAAVAGVSGIGRGPGGASGFKHGLKVSAEIADAAQLQQLAIEEGLAAFNLLPKARQAEALARFEILRCRDAFLAATGLPKKKGTGLFIKEYKAGTIELPDWVAPAIGTRNGQVALSWSSLYRWEKAHREKGLAGLAKHHAATRSTQIPEHMQKFIEAMIVDRPHVSIAHLVQGLQARYDGQAIPSASSVRRFARKWKDENANLFLFLTDPDKWKGLRMAAFGQADENVYRLNQIWEFDSTPTDIMLTDGRHTLIGVIDVYSRRAKLLVASSSNAAAVAALFRNALLDWGVPEVAKTDNGSDYVSNHIVRVLDSLNVEQVICNPFAPEEKPHIERFFKTYAHGFQELMPGYIGHSIVDRKAIESRRTFAQRLMKQGGDPIEIKMDAAELQKVCDLWCNSMYHQAPHSSLDGKSPAERARAWKKPVKRVRNERALDMLLQEAPAGDGMREVRKKGIRLDNTWFIAPELGPYVGQRVRVLLDKTDYGTIYVFHFNADGSQEYLCRAVCPRRTGHDRAEIAAIAKATQRKFMSKGRTALKKAARKAGVDAIDQEILGYHKRKAARIAEFPQQSEDYETPMLNEAARAINDVERRITGPEPIGITPEEEAAAQEVINLADRKNGHRPMPANPWERYSQLCEDLQGGVEVSDKDLAWMKKYELYLESGDRVAN